jgi:hypothetical protein
MVSRVSTSQLNAAIKAAKEDAYRVSLRAASAALAAARLEQARSEDEPAPDAKRAALATVPESASSAGSAGQTAHDSQWLYVCVEANSWRRVALEKW